MDLKMASLLVAIFVTIAVVHKASGQYPSGGSGYSSAVTGYSYGRGRQGRTYPRKEEDKKDREQPEKFKCPRMPACIPYMMDATENMKMLERDPPRVGSEKCREEPETCMYKDWLKATDKIPKPSYECWKQLDAMFKRPIKNEGSSRRL